MAQKIGSKKQRRKPRKNKKGCFRLYLSAVLISFFSLIAAVSWTISTILASIATYNTENIIVDDSPLSKAKTQARATIPDIHISLNSEDALNDWEGNDGSALCTPWSVTMDEWWSRHPLYEIALQNTSHQCFSTIQNPTVREFYTKLQSIQFPDNCRGASNKFMTGSGWGVDMSHVVDGLRIAESELHAVQVVAPVPWQYASGLHGSKYSGTIGGSCQTGDLNCFFLPLSNCSPPLEEGLLQKPKISYHHPWRGFAHDNIPYILQYAARARTWLREAAVQVANAVELELPCAVTHVRRADVILHGKFSRRYHSIDEYLSALDLHEVNTKNLLLLTDDANAIKEALGEYSTGHKWFYVDRIRHEGPNGGWENQIPSEDPLLEVVLLHAEFYLAQQCQTLVHTKSNLADYIYAYMLLQNPSTRRISLDDGVPHELVHSSSNANTARISTHFG